MGPGPGARSVNGSHAKSGIRYAKSGISVQVGVVGLEGVPRPQHAVCWSLGAAQGCTDLKKCKKQSFLLRFRSPTYWGL